MQGISFYKSIPWEELGELIVEKYEVLDKLEKMKGTRPLMKIISEYRFSEIELEVIYKNAVHKYPLKKSEVKDALLK